MNIKLIAVGKTDQAALNELIGEYEKRLSRYVKFELEIIPDPKNAARRSEGEQMKLEAELIRKKLKPGDQVVLFDERGRQQGSVAFANYLQQRMNSGIKRLVFIIGGPYGFDPELKSEYNAKISLSEMTFSHQMVRLFVVEQLYRAFTILKNEPYHHR